MQLDALVVDAERGDLVGRRADHDAAVEGDVGRTGLLGEVLDVVHAGEVRATP